MLKIAGIKELVAMGSPKGDVQFSKNYLEPLKAEADAFFTALKHVYDNMRGMELSELRTEIMKVKGHAVAISTSCAGIEKQATKLPQKIRALYVLEYNRWDLVGDLLNAAQMFANLELADEDLEALDTGILTTLKAQHTNAYKTAANDHTNYVEEIKKALMAIIQASFSVATADRNNLTYYDKAAEYLQLAQKATEAALKSKAEIEKQKKVPTPAPVLKIEDLANAAKNTPPTPAGGPDSPKRDESTQVLRPKKGEVIFYKNAKYKAIK